MGQQASRERVVAFGKLMAALTTLKRRDRVSEFDMEVYASQTADIPMNVLSRAVSTWLREQTWFPTVHELLETCEKTRVEMRAALKHEPCGQCLSGWSFAEDSLGYMRARRCECWTAHQQRVEALGVPAQPLALPSPEEMERVTE